MNPKHEQHYKRTRNALIFCAVLMTICFGIAFYVIRFVPMQP